MEIRPKARWAGSRNPSFRDGLGRLDNRCRWAMLSCGRRSRILQSGFKRQSPGCSPVRCLLRRLLSARASLDPPARSLLVLDRPPSRPVLVRQRPAGQLTVGIDLVAGRITLAGELNRQTAHHLLDAARTLSAVPLPRWIMDAEQLQFCDSIGLRAISACYRTALRHGATMRIVGATRGLRRALAALRLDNHLMDGDCAAEEVDADRAYPLAKVYQFPGTQPRPSAAPSPHTAAQPSPLSGRDPERDGPGSQGGTPTYGWCRASN
ncbi:STAS domain-containing protein [Geodermatophilus sp. DSM 44513]|uniref:STAS domain-containing protein n=1 Tax=Geodermatophilus sp. DSM 44513 TaxID=1528104 RepID=UPI0037BF9501